MGARSPARQPRAALAPSLQHANNFSEFCRKRAIGRLVRQERRQVSDDLVDRKLTIGIRPEHLGLLDGRF